jgi:2-iminobutanoate/2-iminopropanoate deaminase
MDKTRIMPADFWDWPLPTTFSQGWRVGNLVFTGGQVSQTPDGRPLHPYDVEAQIEEVFANIGIVLREAGADLADIVKLNTYWVHDGDDQDDFYKHMTEIRHRYLADPGPAATAVRVAGLAVEGLVIEIEAVAVVPDGS